MAKRSEAQRKKEPESETGKGRTTVAAPARALLPLLQRAELGLHPAVRQLRQLPCADATLEASMNNRFGSERERYGEFGPATREGERSAFRRGDDDEGSRWGRGEPGSFRGESPSGRSERGWGEQRYASATREPRYSSDEDETYGSEWQRGSEESRFAADRGRPSYAESSSGQGRSRQGSWGQGDGSRRGWYARGQSGAYGGGTSGYQGGYASGGYGGSTGTSYRESGWDRVGYGSSQGSSYDGERDLARERGFVGRDFGGAGSDWGGPSRGGFAGRGPKGYTRTDERIREDVCDRLSRDDEVDATEIEVRVHDGEVTLEGTVPTRHMKHRAEDLADDVPGVKDVDNDLRVMKGLLNELKDKVSGNQAQAHYANTGTKETPGTTSQTSANGRA
jgi:hypothetical protein